MSTMGMQVELSMTAKGVQATLKDAQGAIVQTASIIKSQLPAASDAAGQGIAKLKEGMGRARETAMFFTQSLGAFGETGRVVQGAVSGLVGAFIGGGGMLLALTAAKTAVELLTSAWEADAKAAEEAGKKGKAAAKEVVDALAQVAKSEQASLDQATYSKRTLLDRQYLEARKKVNAELAESAKRTGDDVMGAERKALIAERDRLDAEYKKAKSAIKGNEEVAQVDAGAAAFKKSEEAAKQSAEKKFQTAQKLGQDLWQLEVERAARETELERQRAAVGQAENEAAWKRQEEEAARLTALERQQAAATKERAKDLEASMKPVAAGMQQIFDRVIIGGENMGMVLQSIFQSALSSIFAQLIQSGINALVAHVMQTPVKVAEATSQAGLVGAGTAAALATNPFTALGAIPAGIAAMQTALAAFVPVAAAAGGFDVGNFSPITQLHPREMVLPANIADPLRQSLAGRGGLGGGVTVNISAVDAPGVRRFFLDNQSALAEAIGEAVRNRRMG